MKKNYYLHLLAIMMVSMLDVAVISCGDPEDPTPPVTNPEKTDPEQPKETSPLIGSWEYVERESGSYRGYAWQSVDTYTYTFKNDGKYEYVTVDTWSSEDERESDGSNTSYEKGNYAYDYTTRTLSIVSEDNKPRSFTVLTLSEKVLTLMWDDGEKWTFSKKN